MRTLNYESDKPLLYLVATPIGNLQEVSPRTIEVLSSVDLVACEDTRVTGKLLSLLGIKKDLVSLREHNEVSVSRELIEKIKKGTKVAYVSDAGYPCISDPGSKLVKICLENEINVAPISGPNAALNALVASGLCEDRFYFHGFLNAKESVRLEELRELAYRKGKYFRIKEIRPFSSKELKALSKEGISAEVSTHNLPIKAEDLKKRLRASSSPSEHIFACKVEFSSAASGNYLIFASREA